MGDDCDKVCMCECAYLLCQFVCVCVCAVKLSSITVYGKTFEWENFCVFHGFSVDRESFPLESLAVYGT